MAGNIGKSFGDQRAVGEIGVSLVAMVLAVSLSGSAWGAPTTVFWDDLEAQTVGGNPGTPVAGMPWVISKPVSDGLGVVIDPAGTSGKVLQFGRYYNTAQAPLAAAAQTLTGLNGNATLSFSYHGLAGTGGYVSSFDADVYGPGGTIASGIRITAQPISPASKLHEIYYLSPAGGMVDSGMSVPSDSWQALSLKVDLSGHSALLTVGSNSETVPLYTCPSMICSAQFGSYAMGSGMGALLGSGMIDNVAITTNANGSSSEPLGDASAAPEPTTLSLMIVAGLVGAAACAAKAVWPRR